LLTELTLPASAVKARLPPLPLLRVLVYTGQVESCATACPAMADTIDQLPCLRRLEFVAVIRTGEEVEGVVLLAGRAADRKMDTVVLSGRVYGEEFYQRLLDLREDNAWMELDQGRLELYQPGEAVIPNDPVQAQAGH